MERIETLSSLKGRRYLQSVFQKLRFENENSGLASLVILWKICTREREINKYLKSETTILHPLGLVRGTALWMQEIVSRHYFSTINSFVYFGAAILLVLVGIRRFSDDVSDGMVIGALIFESALLLFLFVVMFFSPNDSIEISAEEGDETKVLVEEIGEIATEFASAVVKLEDVTDSLNQLNYNQSILLEKIDRMITNQQEANSPNPQMMERFRDTNEVLADLKVKFRELTEAAEKLKSESFRYEVRKELERMLQEKLKA